MTLPFPKPLPVVSRALSGAPSLPCPTACRLDDLTPLVDWASRALRELQDAAGGVPCARLLAAAADAAGSVEEAGYDLFLAVGEAGR